MLDRKMEEVAHRTSVAYISAPEKRPGDFKERKSLGSMRPLVLNSKSTVFLAANERGADAASRHVVTIRINTDTDKAKPKISSVHLKNEAEFDPFKTEKKSLVRLNVDESLPKIVEHDEFRAEKEKPPYIYCNYASSLTGVMSSGQCSPSDTLDSGTCSDLDSSPPPPLPKKKNSKNTNKKVSVTLIGSDEPDFADNDSNISCDSLNSSELGSAPDDTHCDVKKKETENAECFIPRGLLRDIRDRTTKVSSAENDLPSPKVSEETKETELTSYSLVQKIKGPEADKAPVVIEPYEERNKVEKEKVRGKSFDADKFYEFHLNEKQFEESASVVCAKSEGDEEYFAGIKDFKSEDPPSTIRSSKGTIRGVKNRVRAGIATFLQIQTTTKSFKEKDAGKVVLYTTTMGIVRNTYQRCVLVKKILRNLLVKYEERDVFMSMEYQDEIRERMKSDQIIVPQLYIDGQHVGDAETVEKLNESGDLRKMLKPYKSSDACNTCQTCGGFRLLPCRICSGSKKSLHRNHFTAEFVALKCMNCDEVGLVRCDACC